MIKTQEQNNHESKLTSTRGVVAEKRRELHWMRVKEEEGDGSEFGIERVWSRVLLGLSLHLRDRFEIVAAKTYV